MSPERSDQGSEPEPQYLGAKQVLDEMARFGSERVVGLDVSRKMILALLGGGFITIGALLSVLLSAGVEAEGPARLLEGLGFSAGFFFVVLSEAALFTEANVVLPATLLREYRMWPRVARFWAVVWVGNLLGAMLIGWLLSVAQHYGPDVTGGLAAIVERKLSYRVEGGLGAWWEIVLSGVLANWLVGMAAFFATMGRTIVGKYVPVFLAVTAFVAANLQHSPANMGVFSLAIPIDIGPGWGTALGWSIIPAGIGNLAGGLALVALPFWFVWRGGGGPRVAD